MASPDTISEAVRVLAQLRRAEQDADPENRERIAAAQSFIEDSVGRSLRPAQAARVLGVSRPVMKQWLDRGEISSVPTLEGHREIPLSEVVDLCEAIDLARAGGSERPLASVLRDRRREANDIDIDRLLPRAGRTHLTPELQSLAYHRLIAERLDEAAIARAQRRLRKWRQSGRIHPRWAEAWDRVLGLPLEELRRRIGSDTPEARELRQTSPFAGLLTEQERRRLIEAVEARGGV